jgi:carbamate kinase
MPRRRRASCDDVTAANALIEEQRREITELQARLREAQESLVAIRTGEVDAVVVEGNGAQGHRGLSRHRQAHGEI